MELRKIINVVTLVVMVSVNIFTPFSYADTETGAVVDTEEPVIERPAIEEPITQAPEENKDDNASTSGNILDIQKTEEPINPIDEIEPELPVVPEVASGNVVSMSGLNSDIEDEHGTTELSGLNNIEEEKVEENIIQVIYENNEETADLTNNIYLNKDDSLLRNFNSSENGIYNLSGGLKQIIWNDINIIYNPILIDGIQWGTSNTGEPGVTDKNARGGENDNQSNSYHSLTDGIGRQGPCEPGFHVPSAGELAVFGIAACKLSNFCTNSMDYNNFPAGQIGVVPADSKNPQLGTDLGNFLGLNKIGAIWTSSFTSSNSLPYFVGRGTNSIYIITQLSTDNPLSVICFKNYIPPRTVKYHPNGGAFSGMGINEIKEYAYNYSGTEIIPIYNIEIPNKEPTNPEQQSGWMFAGWYTTSGDWTNQEEEFDPEAHELDIVYAKWLPFNDIVLRLGGSTYTIMDRNLGAEDIAEGKLKEDNDNNPENIEKIGYYYQRGNNHGYKEKENGNQKYYKLYEHDDYSNIGASNLYLSNGIIKVSDNYKYQNDLWGGDSYSNIDSDKRGPCPKGYHIPDALEWGEIIKLIKNYQDILCEGQPETSKCFTKVLKLPFAAYLWLNWSNNKRYRKTSSYIGEDGSYRTATPYSKYNFFSVSKTYLSYKNSRNPSDILPIRCFKDNTRYTIKLNNYEIDDEGNEIKIAKDSTYTTPKPANENHKSFKGRYTTSGFEQGTKIETETITINKNINLYAKRECEEGSIETSDGECNEITEYSCDIIGDSEGNNSFKWNTITIGDYMIMDRNLGAKEAGTGQNSYGYYYQRGNNYGFLDAIDLNKSSTRISRNDNYLSGYAGDTFIRGYTDYWENNEHYNGLWGGGNDTESNGYGIRLDILDKMRQGPCPKGWHVPSGGERADLIKTRANKNGASYGGKEGRYYLNSKQTEFSNYFKLPFAGQLQYSNYYVGYKGIKGIYQSSTPASNSYPSNSRELFLSGTSIAGAHYIDPRALGRSVRCFRDTPLITYNTNGGLIRGELEQEIKLNQPKNILKPRKKGHRDFKGWYTTSGFEQGTKIETKTITARNHNDINLYAKWECENGYTPNGDICEGPETALITIGEEFNKKIKTLAKGEEVTSSHTPDDLIKHIKRSYKEEIPSGKRWTIISDEISDLPIYARFDESDSTIYYKTEAEKIYMNDDSSGIFGRLNNLETVDAGDWNTSKVTNMDGLFFNCSSLTNLDVNNWDTSNVTSINSTFYGCKKLTSIDVSKWNTSNVEYMNALFQECIGLTGLDLSNFKTDNVQGMSNMFYDCTGLETLILDGWNLKKTGTPGGIFQNTTSLKYLSMSGWKTPSDFQSGLGRSWGASTSPLDEIDVTNRDLSGTRIINGLFANASLLKNIKGINTWKNTDSIQYMGSLFYADNSLKGVDLSGLDFSSVKIMSQMFQECYSLEYINFTNVKTRDITDLSLMFLSDNNLKNLDLSSFNTSNVKNMNVMFFNNKGLTELDLSNFDTSNVINMSNMFQGADNLKTIYVSDKFTTGNVTSSSNMFNGTTSIVGGNGTTYDANHIDKEYARIDTPEISGYFTNILDKPYNITYNLDNGIISGEVKTIYTQRDTFTLPIPTKQGYVFKGWIGSNGNNPQVEVRIGAGTIKGDLEYTATWEVEDSGNHYSGGGRKSTSDDKEHYTAVQEAETETIKVVDNQDNDNKDSNQVINDEPNSNVTNNKDYSQEQKDAYSFAKSNGITTTSTIKDAKMNTNITRIEMAKMLSYYAINVLGKTPDTSKTIKFKDVSKDKNKQYDNGVTLAYQLGIMGQNVKNNKFRPNDEVTRAELVTSLSRMLYGTPEGTNKGTSKYYEPHMAKLYNEGIITNTDPNLKEKRGYLMTMLMRSTIK